MFKSKIDLKALTKVTTLFCVMRYHLLMSEHTLLMTSTRLDLRQIMLESVVMPRCQYLIKLFQFDF